MTREQNQKMNQARKGALADMLLQVGRIVIVEDGDTEQGTVYDNDTSASTGYRGILKNRPENIRGREP
jgi:hypothetical protein